jgi:hypothetical protein
MEGDDEPILKRIADRKRKRGSSPSSAGTRPMSKKAKQSLYRPYPGCTANAEFSGQEMCGAEVWDPVVAPIFRSVADAAVLVSGGREVTPDVLNKWLTKELRSLLELQTERGSAVGDQWSIRLSQIAAQTGSAETKLRLVKGLSTPRAKEDDLTDESRRVIGELATNCVDTLLAHAQAGKLEPLTFFLQWYFDMAENSAPTYLNPLSVTQVDACKEALQKSRLTKLSRKLVGKLLAIYPGTVGPRHPTGVHRSGCDVGVTADTMAYGSASSPTDPLRRDVNANDDSSSLRRDEPRAVFGNAERLDRVSVPSLRIPKKSSAVSEAQFRPATSDGAVSPNFNSGDIRIPYGYAAAAQRPVPNADSRYSLQSDANASSIVEHGERILQDVAHQAISLPAPPATTARAHASSAQQQIALRGKYGFEQYPPYTSATGNAYDSPRDSRSGKSEMAKRTYGGNRPAKRSIERPSPPGQRLQAVTFNGPPPDDNRPYMREAARVVEGPAKDEVVHLFWDCGDPLNWEESNPSYIEEVKENMRCGKLHSIMGLHAMIKARINKLQAEQEGRPWVDPETLRVQYPSAGGPQ